VTLLISVTGLEPGSVDHRTPLRGKSAHSRKKNKCVSC
jgi:hypothetical protein